METEMTTKDDVKLMVLSDLAALCKKIAEQPTITKELRAQAQQFAGEYESLAPLADTSTNRRHFEEEQLLNQIARFLPKIAGDED